MGKAMLFSSVKHHPNVSAEFTIKQPDFSFPRWLLLSAFFNCVGISLNMHHQDSIVMSIILVILIIILLLKIYFKVKQESLLVISSLGIQLTTTFMTGRKKAQFIDLNHIHDIVILEGITMHSVIFYLSVLLKENSTSSYKEFKVLPLFTQSWPNLGYLQQIYQGVQLVLWPSKMIQKTQ